MNIEKHVFALVGKAGSGKDSLAAYLMNEFDGVAKLQWAGPLKRMCAEVFGYDLARLEDLDYKEEQDPNLPEGWTRRRVLQHVGTEGFRAIDPNIWVKMAMEEAEAVLTHPEINAVIFTDTRFLNEAAAVRDLRNGYIIKVERTDDTPTVDGAEAAAHASEMELDRIVPHVTMKAAYGDLPGLYAQGHMTIKGAGLSEATS